MRGWLVAVVVGAGCYHGASDTGDCTISCATAPCPGDLVCGAHQLCRAQTSAECGMTGTPGMDAASDALDAPSGTICYGDGLLRPCVPPQTMDLDYNVTTTIDTSSCSTIVSATRGTACVIAARNVTISADILVTGPMPLLLLGTDSLTIASSGVVDASSHSGATNVDVLGAGSQASCGWTMGNGKGNTISKYAGSSGGAGGSFGASGGAGGDSGGYLGASAAQATAPTVIGGCPGGSGGPSGSTAGPAGGAGGGAVYLVTGGTLSISGTINVSGAGGHATPLGSGGAGGGAGGFVGLDAHIYSATSATIYAIGGGGSCGAGSVVVGSQGSEATGPTATTACTDGTIGGNGGGGGVATGDPGSAGVSGGGAIVGGGGGGGGGGGIIAVANLAQFPQGVTTIQPNPVAMP